MEREICEKSLSGNMLYCMPEIRNHNDEFLMFFECKSSRTLRAMFFELCHASTFFSQDIAPIYGRDLLYDFVNMTV